MKGEVDNRIFQIATSGTGHQLWARGFVGLAGRERKGEPKYRH